MANTLAIIAGDGRFVATTEDPTVVRVAASLMRVEHDSGSPVADAYNRGVDAALGLIAQGWE